MFIMPSLFPWPTLDRYVKKTHPSNNADLKSFNGSIKNTITLSLDDDGNVVDEHEVKTEHQEELDIQQPKRMIETCPTIIISDDDGDDHDDDDDEMEHNQLEHNETEGLEQAQREAEEAKKWRKI